MENYWIDENLDTWIKDTIPASSTITRYIKKTGSYTPNGDNVFELFDDFSNGSLDTTKWPSNSLSGITFSDNRINFGGTNFSGYIQTDATWGVGITQRSRVYLAGDNNGFHPNGFWSSTSNCAGLLWHPISTTNITYTRNNSTWTPLGTIVPATPTLYDMETTSESSSLVRFKLTRVSDGVVVLNTTISNSVSNERIRIGKRYDDNVASTGNLTGTYIESFYVRKYLATEPIVTVNDMGTYYKVDIENTTGTDMTDVQVKIPGVDLNTATQTESLEITETEPVSFMITTNSTTAITDSGATLNGEIGGLE